MKQPLRRVLVALTGVAVGSSLLAAPAGALNVVEPGSSGIGDSYFSKDGNGGYDVAHYDIHDTYGVYTGRLRGWTGITATALDDLSSFNLDLVLTPDSVTVDGRLAAFRKSGRHELVVTPTVPLTSGTRFAVRVRYHGTPSTITYDGASPWLSVSGEAMAMNEPHIAPWWFPANDHPSDKAAFDITVKVRSGKQAISNGHLVGRTRSENWTSWHWRMRQPMATYLAFFAAGGFRLERGVTNGLPWTNAVSRWYAKPVEDQQLRLMRRTPGIIAWLETQLVDYPFSSSGGVVTSLATGFALENQSRPTYPYLGSGPNAVAVVVHELAHQWFGDQVSVERWRDIWLNEGFASWVEWRYAETHGGETAQHRLRREYAARPATRSFWTLPISNPGPGRLFNAPVYDRGAMTLQALRQRIGNADFFELLRTWLAQNADGNARVDEFTTLAEDVSGENLDAFFGAWLDRGSRPARTAANGLL